ncbi:MAG TPA: MBL fold metallo-hydrolase [Mycobacteriales bacterium]|nr:MBL fold metallo-hydrolase [Mycobacteriales bacterium]
MARDAAVPLAKGVWRIPTSLGDFVNSYAFRDADGSVTLVDAGLGLRWAHRKLRAGLQAIGAAPGDVRRVVVTHAHSDHAGGLARMVAYTGADVASHEREAVYLRDGRTPRFHGGRRTSFAKVTVAEEFLNGSVLPVAGGLRVVHTPGHTPGHVSLLHLPTGVLVTGDALFNLRGIRYSPGSLCTDPELNRKSVDGLGDLDFEVVAFTHGPEIRHGARAAVRAFLRGRER